MTQQLQAVIIAGGKGTRLSEYTKEIPKPMILIGGKPVLQHQVECFVSQGVTDIIITVGYLKEEIINYFGNGHSFGASITYIEEKEPLGTCGAFFYLKDSIRGAFFVAFGDILFDIDLQRFYNFHEKHGGVITLVGHPNSHPYDSDLLICGKDGVVVDRIDKKGSERNFFYRNLVNSGVYLMSHDVLQEFNEPVPVKMDLESDLIAALIPSKKVMAYVTPEYLKDMGTYSRLSEVTEQYDKGIVAAKNLLHPQPCVFLDRDGTLNKNVGLLYKEEQLELEHSVPEAIRLMNHCGYLCVVITNQPVIARNLCSIEELEEINRKMETLLGREGAYLDAIYWCPHHPDSGYPEERVEYKIKCDCRKPAIGLIQKAVADLHIDLSRSYMIGDTTMDIMTGKNAGIPTILVETGEAGQDNRYDVVADHICSDLLEASQYIIKKGEKNEL